MMAGTGVRVGGAGMLRARRRDCSVKPNRKLDRKSSRGMIYENEELRLRTIHINAEVEQGKEFMILPDYYVSIVGITVLGCSCSAILYHTFIMHIAELKKFPEKDPMRQNCIGCLSSSCLILANIT